MKTLLALAAASFVTAPSSPAPYTHNEAAIVRVACTTPSGTTVGTAVRIGPETYITAAHVVDAGECKASGAAITVTVTDRVKDYAFFTGPASAETMPLNCSGYRAKRIYMARGYAGGGIELFDAAWLATGASIGPLRVLIGEAVPGMSGGPVIDSRGRLTGIVNMRWPTRSLPLDSTPVCP